MGQLSIARAAREGSRGSRRGVVHFKKRGGSLGLNPIGTDDLISQIERGLPFKALESLAVLTGLPVATIALLLRMPERTLARRKAAGRLAAEESERLLRISGVFEDALKLFEGNVDAAVTWLTSPKRALGHNTPLAYSRTEPGAREVENLIGRLEHGVFS